MTPIADTGPAPGAMAASITEDRPSVTVAILSSALNKLRETAHMIEDRARCLLMPEGPSIADLRILVVDDHPDTADSLVAVLELVGCSARASYDGWSALRAAEDFEPHVCLLDLMMPDLGGLELAARLRVWGSGKPLLLIAVTALGDETTLKRVAVAGFDWHETKPVDTQELLATIARLWALTSREDRSFPRLG